MENATNVNWSALSGLRQTMPIFSVASVPENTNLISDEIYYPKTIPLPQPKFGSMITVSLPEYLDLEIILAYDNLVRKPIDLLQTIEKNTMCQTTDIWHKERDIRVTASKIYDILHSTNLGKTCESFIANKNKDISKVAPILLGRRLEPVVKNIIRSDYPNHIFRNTGLVVHPDIPFLGASPDGLLFSSEGSMLIEIKCVYNPKHLSLEQLCEQRKTFYLEKTSDGFKLRENHTYYYQIQCQLFCSGLSKCLFVVCVDLKTPPYREIIYADAAFWTKEKLQILRDFYFDLFFPSILKN